MAQSARDLEPGRPAGSGGRVRGVGATRAYDFRTGSELSREALSQLRMYSERLATALGRIINAYLDSPIRFEVVSVEGQGLEQFLSEVPRHCAMGMVELSGGLPPILWQLDPELLGPVVGRMLGGPAEALDRPATLLEAALLRRFIGEMVEIWATSWERLGRREPSVAEVLTEAVQLRGKVREGEMVTVEMSAEIAGVGGQMRVALPVATAQRLLGDQGAVEERREVDPQRLRQSGERIVVPVSVILHRTQIRLSDATKLQTGDVIPLGKPVSDPMIVCVRGRPKFLAETGTADGRLAAKLIGPCREGVTQAAPPRP
ncbi:MAG: FliM/FliN family flagellar motor switch protein [Armatimonadota bacterium]|jgi:flagellar motor switch protein FliM